MTAYAPLNLKQEISKMIQITLTKNDEFIGYTVYFVYEGEEMSSKTYDTYDQAIEGFREMAKLI